MVFLRVVCYQQALPFLGFGFLDNFVMITVVSLHLLLFSSSSLLGHADFNTVEFFHANAHQKKKRLRDQLFNYDNTLLFSKALLRIKATQSSYLMVLN